MKRKRRRERQAQAKLLAAADGERKPSARKKAKLAIQEGSGLPHGYHEGQRILLVGEGNFSFARALARLFSGNGENVTATSYDSREMAAAKYNEGHDPLSDVLEELEGSQVRIRFGVDATNLQRALKVRRARKDEKAPALAFDRITFNFPHIGLGIKDQDVNVEKNRELLGAFLRSACAVLHPSGKVHVTLKEGKPYDTDLWNVVGTAHHATGGLLRLTTTLAYNPEDFPGYHHSRTSGYSDTLSAADNEEIRGRSRTYVFSLRGGC